MNTDGTIFLIVLCTGAVAAVLLVRDALRYRGKVMEPVKSQAPVDSLGDAFDEAAWARGWEDTVEDFELLDAFITDQHCAELDEWFGPTPVLPDTPDYARRLASL